MMEVSDFIAPDSGRSSPTSAESDQGTQSALSPDISNQVEMQSLDRETNEGSSIGRGRADLEPRPVRI